MSYGGDTEKRCEYSFVLHTKAYVLQKIYGHLNVCVCHYRISMGSNTVRLLHCTPQQTAYQQWKPTTLHKDNKDNSLSLHNNNWRGVLHIT